MRNPNQTTHGNKHGNPKKQPDKRRQRPSEIMDNILKTRGFIQRHKVKREN